MKYIIILLFLSINLQAQTYEQLIENFHQPEYNNLRDQLEKTPQDQEDLELRKCYPFHKSELALTEEEQRLNVAYYERLDILKDRLKNVGNVSERDDIQKSINQLEAERLNELRAFFAPYSNSIYGKYRMEFYPNNTGRANIHIIKEDNIESNLLELSQEPFLQKIKEFQLDFASLKKRYNSYLLWSGVEQYTVSFAMHWEQFQQLEALFLSGDGGNQRMHLNPYRKKITLDALPKLPNLKRLSLASLNIEDVSSVYTPQLEYLSLYEINTTYHLPDSARWSKCAQLQADTYDEIIQFINEGRDVEDSLMFMKLLEKNEKLIKKCPKIRVETTVLQTKDILKLSNLERLLIHDAGNIPSNLDKLKKLKTLVLKGKREFNKHLKMPNIKSLQELNFATFQRFNLHSFPNLSKLPKLRTLNLIDNYFENPDSDQEGKRENAYQKFFEQIDQIPNLEILHYQGKFHVKLLDQIKNNPILKATHITYWRRNSLVEKDLEPVFKLNKIKYLSLDYRFFTDEDKPYQQFSEAPKEILQNLEYLLLDGNYEDDLLLQFKNAPKLKHLRLNGYIENLNLNDLKQFTNLESLVVSMSEYCDSLRVEGMNQESGLKELKHLCLWSRNRDIGKEAILGFSNLKAFGQLPNLEHLEVDAFPHNFARLGDEIKSLKQLKKITLHYNPFLFMYSHAEKEDLEALLQKVPNLETLVVKKGVSSLLALDIIEKKYPNLEIVRE